MLEILFTGTTLEEINVLENFWIVGKKFEIRIVEDLKFGCNKK